MTNIPIKIQFVKSLHNLKPNRVIVVKPDNASEFQLWVTDKNALPFPIKDNTGSGGITSISNTDGNLSITGGNNKIINLSASVVSILNSALQAGDNISDLLNDAGYITIADIPSTKLEFNTQLSDGDFLFVGDVTQYTDENAQDAVGNILIDTSTIGFSYNDLTNQITADVRANSITANELSDTISISEFVNDANYASETYVDNKIVQTIDEGDIDHSPSGDVLFTALRAKQNLPTGFITGLELSIHPTDNTKAVISEGAYTITDFSDLTDIKVVIVQVTTPIEFTPQYLNTNPASYVALDIDQNVVQSSSPFDNEDRRTLALIGATIHSNLTVINVVNEIKAPIVAPTNQLHDLIKAVGSLNLEGNVYYPNGANLQINKTAGTIWGLGINAQNYLDPHKLNITAQTAVSFRYRLRDTSLPNGESTDVASIDPDNYDNAGVKTTVPNNRYTIQRINLFQSGLTRIQYGQKVYQSLEEAKTLVQTDSFVTEMNIADNAIFRAYLIIKKGVTNLTTAVANGDAEFIPVDKFGNVIGGAGIVLNFSNITTGLGYVPEDEANKVTDLTNPNNTTYPTTQAVTNHGFNILISTNYNATTNTPTLSDITGKKGEKVVVGVAGTQDFGSGNITVNVNDILSHNGSVWFKEVDNNQGGLQTFLFSFPRISVTRSATGNFMAKNSVTVGGTFTSDTGVTNHLLLVPSLSNSHFIAPFKMELKDVIMDWNDTNPFQISIWKTDFGIGSPVEIYYKSLSGTQSNNEFNLSTGITINENDRISIFISDTGASGTAWIQIHLKFKQLP